MREDVLTLEDEPEEGEPLLAPVLLGGRRVAPLPTVAEARVHAADELARLPEPLRRLDEAWVHPVIVAEPLRALARELDAR